MPRGPRVAPGGLVYHVLNRGVARLALFEKDADYEAFERVMAEAMQEFPTRLLSYCVMPNHWETDEHFYTVLRNVERNALRANLVRRAEEWRWSSLWRRQFGDSESRKLLSAWPLPRPRDWRKVVNRPQSEAELKALRQSVQRGTPFGTTQWQVRTANRLGLEWTIRPRGRPRKAPAAK